MSSVSKQIFIQILVYWETIAQPNNINFVRQNFISCGSSLIFFYSSFQLNACFNLQLINLIPLFLEVFFFQNTLNCFPCISYNQKLQFIASPFPMNPSTN